MLLSYELWVSLPMKLDTGEIKRKRRWVLPGVSWLSKHCHKKQNSLQTSSKIVRLWKKETFFQLCPRGMMGLWEGWWSLPVEGLQSVPFSLLSPLSPASPLPSQLPKSLPLLSLPLLPTLYHVHYHQVHHYQTTSSIVISWKLVSLKNILKRTFYIKLSF